MPGDILNQILEQSAIGIAVLSPGDRWLFANGRFASVLGYSVSELAGKTRADLVHPQDFGDQTEEVARVRSGSVPSARFEARFLTRDGRGLWAETIAANLSGPGIARGTVLFISRDVTARRESERGFSLQHLVSRILVGADSLAEAVGEILSSIGERLRWDVAAYWEVDPEKQVLVPLRTWRSAAHHQTAFEESTRSLALARGDGIPGRVWEKDGPLWESDFLAIPQLPRSRAAREEGLHAVFAFPVRTASEFYGVVEFFSRDVLPPDATLLDAAEGIGYQIGQFLERRRAQAAGQASEVRKAAILDTALDCIISMDGAGKITEFNPAAEATFGYRKEDVIGKEMAEIIVPPSLREAHRAGLRRYRATGEARVLGKRIEITGMRSDGTEFPVELAILRVPLPGPIFFTAYLRDLTERRRLEEHQRFLLKASDQLSSSLDYETTVRTVAQLAVPGIADWCAVDLVTREGKLRRVAVAHADPAKVSEVAELERKYPSDPDAPYGVPQVVRSGESEWAAEIPDELLQRSAKSPDHLRALRELGLRSYITVPLKSRRRVLGALTLVDAESGRRFAQPDVELAEDLARRMATAIDNALLLAETEESRVRLAEQADELETTAEEMAAAHEELEVTNEEIAAANEELQRKTDALVAALAAAEEANVAKSAFLATMSHELRTPLNAIGGYAELIKLGIRGPVTEQQQIDLERIERSQSQLLTLINDILKFAKLQSGTIDFEMREFSVDGALCHSDDLVRPQMEAKMLTYAYEGGDPAVTVCADEDRFQQVILNLLSNAVKFTPADGRIGVSWHLDGKNVAISISDSGVGIPQEKLLRIFDPFVQVNAPAAKTSEGVGLGLAISRDIAQRMKGTLTVVSEVGKGSVFTLTLPRGKDLPVESAPCTAASGLP